MTPDEFQDLDVPVRTASACWVAATPDDGWHGVPIPEAGNADTSEGLLAVTATQTGWLAVGHGSHDASIVSGQHRPLTPPAPLPATHAMCPQQGARRFARAVDQDPHTGQIVVGGDDVVALQRPHQSRSPVLLASEDGRIWTDLAPSGAGTVTAVHAAAEPGPLAIGYDDGLAVWAPARGGWRRRRIAAPALPPDVVPVASVWTGTRFVVVGDYHPHHRCRPFVVVSEDGWRWRPAYVGSDRFAEGVWGRMNAVVMAGDLLVAVGAENAYSRHCLNGAVWVSEDGGERWELIFIDDRQPANVQFHAVAVDHNDRLWAGGSVHHVDVNRAEPLMVTATEPGRWKTSEVVGQARPAQSKATVRALTSTTQGLVAVGVVEDLVPVNLDAESVVWQPDETH